MYKPANIREFVTPAILKRTEVQKVNGRTQKISVEVGTIRGKFKQKNSSELTANGLVVVKDDVQFVTWWKQDFKAGDVLIIGGIEYAIKGQPENVEMRSRYAVLSLERLEGGA